MLGIVKYFLYIYIIKIKVMSRTKEYYLETLGMDTSSVYDDVEYNNPPLDLFLDEEIECNLTEQEIYEAELLSEYVRKANQI